MVYIASEVAPGGGYELSGFGVDAAEGFALGAVGFLLKAYQIGECIWHLERFYVVNSCKGTAFAFEY